MKTNYPSIPTYGESTGGGIVEPPPIPGVWQDFNMIAGAWSTNAGYSNGDYIAAAGSISREPVTGFTMSYLYTNGGGSLLGRISGDVSGHLSESGRLIMVDETYISTVFGVEFTSGHTDFSSPLPITFADGISYAIKFPLLSELTPVAAAFSAGPELYPANLTNPPPWVIEGYPITIYNSAGTAYLTMTWDTDHWVHDSSDLTDATGDGTISGGPSGTFWWPISWTGFAPPPEPIVGYRYWGMRLTQGGSVSENRIREFVVSTTAGNTEANAITNGTQFGWHPSDPTGISGSYADLIDGDSLTGLNFNKASANGNIIYADMGAPIEAESMSIHPGTSTYRLASVQAVGSNDLVTWDDLASAVTTNLNTLMTIYTKP